MSTTELISRQCPLCGIDNSGESSLMLSETYRLKRCRVCRFVYLECVPDYARLQDDYQWRADWKAEESRRADEQPVVQNMSRTLRRAVKSRRRKKLDVLMEKYRPDHPANLLDIGCGTGRKGMKFADWYTPYGIEIEPPSAAEADRKFRSLGGYVTCLPALEGLDEFRDVRFDAVLMNAYLEHEMHPTPVLEKLRSLCTPECKLFIKVPNYASLNRRVRGRKWCGFHIPSHVNYFTPETLQRMIEATGYRVVQFGLFDRFPTNDSMWMIAGVSG